MFLLHTVVMKEDRTLSRIIYNIRSIFRLGLWMRGCHSVSIGVWLHFALTRTQSFSLGLCPRSEVSHGSFFSCLSSVCFNVAHPFTPLFSLLHSFSFSCTLFSFRHWIWWHCAQEKHSRGMFGKSVGSLTARWMLWVTIFCAPYETHSWRPGKNKVSRIQGSNSCLLHVWQWHLNWFVYCIVHRYI